MEWCPVLFHCLGKGCTIIKSSRYQLLLLPLITSAAFLPIETMATTSEDEVPSITRVDSESVDRTWDNIDLLYEAAFHDPVKLDEEIAQIAALVPDLVDVEVF